MEIERLFALSREPEELGRFGGLRAAALLEELEKDLEKSARPRSSSAASATAACAHTDGAAAETAATEEGGVEGLDSGPFAGIEVRKEVVLSFCWRRRGVEGCCAAAAGTVAAAPSAAATTGGGGACTGTRGVCTLILSRNKVREGCEE